MIRPKRRWPKRVVNGVLQRALVDSHTAVSAANLLLSVPWLGQEVILDHRAGHDLPRSREPMIHRLVVRSTASLGSSRASTSRQTRPWLDTRGREPMGLFFHEWKGPVLNASGWTRYYRCPRSARYRFQQPEPGLRFGGAIRRPRRCPDQLRAATDCQGTYWTGLTSPLDPSC